MPFVSATQSDLHKTIQLRIDCAAKIEKAIKIDLPDAKYKLTEMHASILLIVPIDELTTYGGNLCPERQRGGYLKYRLDHFGSLVKHFIQSKKKSLFVVNDLGDPPFPIPRDDKEKDACRIRDGNECVFMHTAIGGSDVFYPNVTKYHSIKTLASSKTGCSDKRWNLIFLNRQIHFWWSQGFLGLKVYGSMPVDENDLKSENSEWVVKVQFHWLSRRARQPTEQITITEGNLSMREMAENQINFENAGMPFHRPSLEVGNVAAVPVDISIPVLSGYIAEFKMPFHDAQKFIVVLEMQLNIIVVAAMSGAAENPDLLPDPDEDDIGSFD